MIIMPEPTGTSPEEQMFFGGRPEHFIVSISDVLPEHVYAYENPDIKVWDRLGGGESVGAIRIGELTRLQFDLFWDEFYRVSKALYIYRLHCERSLSSNAKISLSVKLSNYEILTDDQKKLLASALRVANQVRIADGCADRNIPNKYEVVGPNVANPEAESPPKKTKNRRRRKMLANPSLTPQMSLHHHLRRSVKTNTRTLWRGRFF